MDPELELTLGQTSLRCTGTLDRRTRPYVLEAAQIVLARRPPSITVDVSKLSVADADAANTLVRLQRMARDAVARLHWVGLEPDRLRGGSR
ncbi:MAG: STAS domain-containing protein [Actinomycetota bacterium]|nr:STAS domain-containing protein [Actinomycetota bacterium]